MGHSQPYPYTHNTVDNRSTLLLIIWVIKHGGGEQPYKSRDMLGSDSGLGRLLINVKDEKSIFEIAKIQTS